MADRPDSGAEREMERTGAEMEHDIEKLSERLDEARKKAPDARLDKSERLEELAGDVAGQEGGPLGQDPTGAIDDEHVADGRSGGTGG